MKIFLLLQQQQQQQQCLFVNVTQECESQSGLSAESRIVFCRCVLGAGGWGGVPFLIIISVHLSVPALPSHNRDAHWR